MAILDQKIVDQMSIKFLQITHKAGFAMLHGMYESKKRFQLRLRRARIPVPSQERR